MPFLELETPLELVTIKNQLLVNIPEIYEGQKTFLHDVEKCGDDRDALADAFIKNVRKHLYYYLIFLSF